MAESLNRNKRLEGKDDSHSSKEGEVNWGQEMDSVC